MAVSRIKEWQAGEILTADELNAELDNLNQSSIAWPMTANGSAAGYEIQNAKLATLKQLTDNVVSIDNYASFAAAISAIGSTVTTLLINQNVNVTANATVPSTCTLWFMGQGKFTVSVAVTCTINGPIVAAPRQIFAGSGTVAFTSNVSLACVYPQWWGNNTTPLTTDMTTEVQAALTAVNSAGGGTVVVLAGDYLISSSLIIYDNTTLKLEADAYLWRNWTSTTSNWQAATIYNEHMPTHASYIVDPGPYTQVSRNSRIRILGPGGFKVTTGAVDEANNNSYFAGPHVSLHFADYCSIDGAYFQQATRQVNVSLNTSHSRFTSNQIVGGTQVFEVGVWQAAGTNNYIGGNSFDTGDDCIGIGTNYNLALDGLTIGPNSYKSQRAHAVQITQNRTGSTASYAASDQYVENISIAGGAGHVGQLRNACIRMSTELCNADKVRNIRWDGFTLEHGSTVGHDNVNPYAIILAGGTNITLRGRVIHPLRYAVQVLQSTALTVPTNIHLDLDADAPQDASFQAVALTNCGEVTVSGHLRCNSVAGILATDVALLHARDLRITEIPSSLSGIQTAGTTKVVASNYRPKEASGATDTRGFASGSTSTTILHAGCDFTEVDLIIGVSSTPALFQHAAQLGAAKSRTVATGSITTNGDYRLSVLCEGGVSDSLATITGGLVGQEIEIINGETDPATVVLTLTHGTGGNALDFSQLGAANYALDTLGKGARFKYQNGTWRALAKW